MTCDVMSGTMRDRGIFWADWALKESHNKPGVVGTMSRPEMVVEGSAAQRKARKWSGVLGTLVARRPFPPPLFFSLPSHSIRFIVYIQCCLKVCEPYRAGHYFAIKY